MSREGRHPTPAAGHSSNGNAHLEHIEEELGALEEDLSEQSRALQTLIGVQERFQQQTVHDVANALAVLLESRLVPIERSLKSIEAKLDTLARDVGGIAAALSVLVRRNE